MNIYDKMNYLYQNDDKNNNMHEYYEEMFIKITIRMDDLRISILKKII